MRLGRGVTAAAVAFVTIPILTVVTSFIGAAPGIGNPPPGTERQSVTTWGAIGIALVAITAFLCLLRTPSVGLARWWRWLPALATCAGVTAVGCYLVYHGRAIEAAAAGLPQPRTGAADFRYGLLAVAAAPLLAAIATGFTRTSARVIVACVAVTSLAFMATLIAYALNHLD